MTATERTQHWRREFREECMRVDAAALDARSATARKGIPALLAAYKDRPDVVRERLAWIAEDQATAEDIRRTLA